MVDGKTLQISIEAIIKDPEMLEFVNDHLNTKKMCKHTVRMLPFLIKYLPDQYKTQRMSDKIILDEGMLMFIPDCYKDQKVAIRPKKCWIKLSGLIVLQYHLFLTSLRLGKCVIKLSILVL